MEAYKVLCEKRILELDPNHPMPVLPSHLGSDELNNCADVGELQRLLSQKDQELQFSK